MSRTVEVPWPGLSCTRWSSPSTKSLYHSSSRGGTSPSVTPVSRTAILTGCFLYSSSYSLFRARKKLLRWSSLSNQGPVLGFLSLISSTFFGRQCHYEVQLTVLVASYPPACPCSCERQNCPNFGISCQLGAEERDRSPYPCLWARTLRRRSPNVERLSRRSHS